MRLNVQRGPAAFDGRPPLLFVHGFALHAGMWRSQLAELGARWPAVAVDLAGFGGSPVHREEVPSVALYADDIAATLAELGADRAIVCGLSMGGYVAIELARTHRELVAGLVLVDTKCEPDDAMRRRSRERIALRLEVEGTMAAVEEEVSPRFVGKTTRERRAEVRSAVDEMVRSTPIPGASWALRAMASRPDGAGALQDFDGPALVVVGEEDEVSPPWVARRMTELLRRSQFACVPEAGHLSPLEAPEAFNASLWGWLTALA